VAQFRRVYLRLYDYVPEQAEIMRWLDSLPADGRGHRIARAVEQALLVAAREALDELPPSESKSRAATTYTKPVVEGGPELDAFDGLSAEAAPAVPTDGLAPIADKRVMNFLKTVSFDT